MTLNETAKIIAAMQVNYPDTFQGMDQDVVKGMVALWHKCFEAEPYKLVEAAVIGFIQTSNERYMPNIGMIKEEIRKLTAPEGMSANEAWARVSKAISNGIYGYREEYAKLPPVLQKCVGSANQLREWAMMDAETVQSVVASNFQRSYRTVQAREEELSKLPEGYREAMQELAGAMIRPMITEGEN